MFDCIVNTHDVSFNLFGKYELNIFGFAFGYGRFVTVPNLMMINSNFIRENFVARIDRSPYCLF